MYQMLHGRSIATISKLTLPPLALSWLIAELFYKWHSFTLECAGFLITWFAIDWVWSKVLGRAAVAIAPADPECHL